LLLLLLLPFIAYHRFSPILLACPTGLLGCLLFHILGGRSVLARRKPVVNLHGFLHWLLSRRINHVLLLLLLELWHIYLIHVRVIPLHRSLLLLFLVLLRFLHWRQVTLIWLQCLLILKRPIGHHGSQLVAKMGIGLLLLHKLV
jgi:hypothetical protein